MATLFRGQVGAQGVGQVFGLAVGGGNDEAERLWGAFAHRGGEVGQQGRVGSGDGPDEGAGATLGGGYGGRGADGKPSVPAG